MRYPVLLQGRTMTPAEVLHPLSMSQSWKENGDTSATITLRKEDPDIAVGAWIQIFSPNGAMDAVCYVKSKKTDHVTGIRTYNLEHCFHLLSEMVIFGEIGPDTMGGSATAVDIKTAISYLLTRQTESLFSFTPSTCTFTTSQGWKFTNSDIYGDLNSLTDAVEDCSWEFVMTSLPWELKLVPWPTEASMEMRKSRNISTMSVTLDRSNMYTRVYPAGKNNLHITGDYIDRNTSTWGVIGKIITDSSIEDETLLRAWAEKNLKKNSTPVVNVSISGLELSERTGEALDRLTVGKMCLVPLPEYGTYVLERIIDITWRNCCADETACTVTMANERKTVQGVLNEIASGGGAGSVKANTAYNCRLGDHEDRIETEEDISSQAGMYIDDYGVIAYSTNTETMVGSRFISLNNRAEMAVGKYRIDPTKLTEYGSKAAFPATGREGYFYGDTSTNKVYTWKNDGGYVELQLSGTSIGGMQEGYYIEAGKIAVAINDSGESTAHIDADHVNISATSTVHALAGELEVDANGKLVIKNAGGMYVRKTVGGVESLFGVYEENNLTGGIVVSKINGRTSTTIDSDKISVGTIGQSDITLNDRLLLNSSGVTTVKGNMVVLAADGGAGTVSSTEYNIYAGGKIRFNGASYGQYWDLSSTELVSLLKAVQVVAVSGTNNYKLQYKSFTATDWIDAGTFSRAVTSISGAWSNGIFSVTAQPQGQTFTTGKVVMPKSAASNSYIDIQLFNSTTDGSAAESTRYTLDSDDDYVYLKWGSTTVARATNNADGSVSDSDFSGFNSTTMHPSGDGYSTSGKLNLGSFSASSVKSSAPGYLAFRVSCKGHTRYCYLVVNS